MDVIALGVSHFFLEIIKTCLMENGADLNAKDNNGKTPMFFACGSGCLDLAQLSNCNYGVAAYCISEKPSGCCLVLGASMSGVGFRTF